MAQNTFAHWVEKMAQARRALLDGFAAAGKRMMAERERASAPTGDER